MKLYTLWTSRQLVAQTAGMANEFSVLDGKRTIVITIEGDVDAKELAEVRQRSYELIEETSYTDFIVDIRDMTSIENGKTFAIVEVGESYSDFRITVWSNTAVLLPTDDDAREQFELMHTIEMNRGRGVINYVKSFDEAFSWFEDMGRRA